MRDVADFLLQITLKKQVANRQIRKSKRPWQIALRIKVASSKFSMLAKNSKCLQINLIGRFSQFLTEPQLKTFISRSILNEVQVPSTKIYLVLHAPQDDTQNICLVFSFLIPRG